jgi:hypothetical protein
MLQPYKSFVMVCAEQQCTNHAKPSLSSGTDLKVKPMLELLIFVEKIGHQHG